MSCKKELTAINKSYVKLMKLPVDDLLPALTAVSIFEVLFVTGSGEIYHVGARIEILFID